MGVQCAKLPPSPLFPFTCQPSHPPPNTHSCLKALPPLPLHPTSPLPLHYENYNNHHYYNSYNYHFYYYDYHYYNHYYNN